MPASASHSIFSHHPSIRCPAGGTQDGWLTCCPQDIAQHPTICLLAVSTTSLLPHACLGALLGIATTTPSCT
jgi:hypothetical protein